MNAKLVRGFVGWIALLSVFVLFLGCAMQEKAMKAPEDTILTHDELVALFSTPRKAKMAGKGGILIFKYDPNGTQYMAGPGRSDSGTYRIEEDTICGKWRTIRSGKEKCAKLNKIGENTYQLLYNDGTTGSTFEFK